MPVKTRYRTGVDDLVRDFYLPCLSRSVTYRRGSGFFNSRTLSMAARGLRPFLERGGKMRLVCSVEMDEADRAVYENPKNFLDRVASDVLRDLDQTRDVLERRRLALLAYMLERGHLEIKIGVLSKSHRLYHEKIGVFEDSDKNRVAFEGSSNETPGGWAGNYEGFSAYISWPSANRLEETRVQELLEDFEELWDAKAPGIEIVPLPDAVRRSLLKFKKDYDPNFTDEEVQPRVAAPLAQWTPGLMMAFDAPRLWNAHEFRFGEVGVKPYEHQDYVAAGVLKAGLPRHLLADEVGLGKTIEAGLILHGLLASGRVTRCLILAPRNALKQWQSELKLKFGIEAWRLEGDKVIPYAPTGEAEQALAEDAHPKQPFRSKNILLVSSQLVRLESRRDQMLDVEYELVIIDEAHHARGRKKGGERAPNKLLEALQQLRYKTQGMLLLTATPIQLDRRELWDLLSLLELPGRWQDEDNFDRYYEELNIKAPAGEPNWAFLFGMAQDALGRWGPEAAEVDSLREAFPGMDLKRLVRLVRDNDLASVARLKGTEKEALRIILYRLSPARQMVYRNSRELLREYFQAGRYEVRLADRKVEQHSIPFDGSPELDGTEANLYQRIDRYVREYYRKYERERNGAGFVLRFYEKRLTSSFHAIKLSLRRRLNTLNESLATGRAEVLLVGSDDRRGMSDEDEEELDDAASEPRRAVEERKILAVAREEQRFLSDFVQRLEALTQDSKADAFETMLGGWLGSKHRKAIIFTQFADTVDYLRRRFVNTYGDRVGIYTGDGGEYYVSGKWVPCTKSELQAKFSDPNETLDILFCTDAASESLNLQACSLVVNYDIPWNPMRIEQRIGRVDRIGQKSPTVDIHILTYGGTVEDLVYQRCLERIRFSLTTLGHFQPILAQEIQDVLKGSIGTEDAETQVDQLLRRLDDPSVAQRVEDIQNRHFLNHYERQLPQHQERVPVTQAELEVAMKPLLEGSGWTQTGGVWERAGKKFTFQPGSTAMDLRGARYLTPRDELGTLVQAPGSEPDDFALGDRSTLHRVGVGTSGRYVAYFVERGGRWFLLRRLRDLNDPSGQSFSGKADAVRFVEAEMRKTEREQWETESKLWSQREAAWMARARLYVNRIAEYVARNRTDPELAPLAGRQFAQRWQAYLAAPERAPLNQVIGECGYEPDASEFQGRRGRAPQSSPRKSESESALLNELEEIRSKKARAAQRQRELAPLAA